MPSVDKGFTLIELVLVIALAAILAAVAYPMIFGGTSAVTVPVFAKKVQEDIRYAQSLALLRSNLDTPNATNPTFRYRIRINIADASCPGSAQYTIVNDSDNNATWGENPNGGGVVESARNPATGEAFFCVRMDTGDLVGFQISADFGGSVPGIIEFDTMGTPYDSDGVKLAASKTITITKDGVSSTVTITPNTGMVVVQ